MPEIIFRDPTNLRSFVETWNFIHFHSSRTTFIMRTPRPSHNILSSLISVSEKHDMKSSTNTWSIECRGGWNVSASIIWYKSWDLRVKIVCTLILLISLELLARAISSIQTQYNSVEKHKTSISSSFFIFILLDLFIFVWRSSE